VKNQKKKCPIGTNVSILFFPQHFLGDPPVDSLNRIHGCLGTTSVTCLSGNRILSTGRDGCVRDVAIDSSGKLVVRTCTRLPMDWVAGILYSVDCQHQLAICYKEVRRKLKPAHKTVSKYGFRLKP